VTARFRLLILAWFAAASVAVVPTLARAEEPPLPPGLVGEKKPDEPALPEGFGGERKAAEPTLPEGLGDPPRPPVERKDDAPAAFPFDLTGFFDVRGGLRTQPDTREKDSTLGESRLQLQLEKVLEALTFRLTTDFLYDISANDYRVFMEQGRGLVDLREAWVAFRPTDFMDVKVGRQVLTWGTGDLRFLNDLFPKDWNAFFIGRDVEYLKAPSDALKVSLFSDLANLDLVYTPRFDADRYVDGRRISYYNPFLARCAGRDAVIDADEPEAWFKDDEFAARLYKMVNGYELALYTYNGFWKSPAGTDPVTFTPVFPRLAAYGASVRGPAAGGIGNVEAAYYDSRENRSGNDPLIPNSQVRLLVGYERDLAAISKDLTVGVQYYLELRMDHEAMERMRPAIFPDSNRDRHEVTLRLTKLLLNQNLTLSLFVFYSPTDEDAYLRPRVAYKVDDHWTVEAGANVLFGSHAHTFFGQFEDNSNVYFGARYSF